MKSNVTTVLDGPDQVYIIFLHEQNLTLSLNGEKQYLGMIFMEVSYVFSLHTGLPRNTSLVIHFANLNNQYKCFSMFIVIQYFT